MTNRPTTTLTLEALSRALGVGPSEMPAQCQALFEKLDLHYRVIEGDRYRELLLHIVKRFDEDSQRIAAPERTEVWRQGWQEALDNYIASGFSEDALIPKFIRYSQPLRVFREYVESPNPAFEYQWVQFVRTWFLARYFDACDHIWEFGAGTGFNLVEAARLFPEKQLWGSDFVPSSVELLAKIAAVRKIRLNAFQFNMLTPDDQVKMPEKSGVFTFGSLEQLGGAVEPMLTYLLRQQPQIVVHVEPAAELYDPTNLHDYLALRFQNKRGYTAGLLAKLKALQQQGRIELLKAKRTEIGSLMLEGYNIFAWRPNGSRA